MGEEIKSILVVEDDVDVCNAIITALTRQGYKTTGVTTAREATFKLKNQKYSCVLLDMRLGEENGDLLIDFMRERKDSANTATPVIVVSGFLDKELVLKIASKIQGAIVKPFEQKDLIAMVEKLIGPVKK